MNARRKRFLYWGTQLVGWGSYVGLFALWNYFNGSLSQRSVKVLVMVFVIGVIVSHLFRDTIIRRGWLDRPIGYLPPRLALGALLNGVLATVAEVLTVDLFFPDHEPLLTGAPLKLVNHLLNWVVLLLLWSLAYLTYHYFAKNRREEIRNLRLETADRENQLMNLRAQINPHFMFNALNNIRALIDEDPDRAKQSITRLSAILRNAMTSVKRKVVPLGEEIDIVRAYLDLEHMRFEERLRVHYAIEEGIEREQVPPMLLQTLVENAVRHGIGRLTAGGDLHVIAHRANGGLDLIVRNSGTYRPGVVNGTGIGLRNTRKRLSLLYGRDASIHIAEQNGEVVTHVHLPTRIAPTRTLEDRTT
ncbi:MAG: histidine kinase [Flavobacteriales bacterium]|nr:histidine kinase [Flavobacteriales bacterium]MCB9193685.1 histidine kinase [Flavobacteriales bacterium]